MHIIVLGGGVVGVTTAYYLLREGHEVTVLDRQAEPARETSFANAGLVAPGHAYTWASPRAPRILWKSLFDDSQALRLKLRADPAMWRWCLQFLMNCTAERSRRNTSRKLALCVYSQRALRELVAETGVAYHGIRRGLLYVYRDAASLERGVNNAGVLRDGGQRMEIFDRTGVVRVEPALAAAPIAGGIYCADDESGDAFVFTQALARRCEAMGARFLWNQSITGFDADRDRVQAVIAGGERHAGDAFVLALGSFSAPVARQLGYRLPVYPVKGYSVTLPVGAGHRPPEVGGVDENHLVAWALMGDRLRFTATAEFSGYDTSHRPEDFAHMLKTARSLFPEGADYDRPAYWSCLRPMTPEGTPILGASSHRNLFFNTGHGHMGWTMSCGTARVVVDLMAGRRPAVDMAGMDWHASRASLFPSRSFA